MADNAADRTDSTPSLRDDIQHALNVHSAENGSDTPDFILAEYLTACLSTFDAAVQARDAWWGINPSMYVIGTDEGPTTDRPVLAPEDRCQNCHEAINLLDGTWYDAGGHFTCPATLRGHAPSNCRSDRG